MSVTEERSTETAPTEGWLSLLRWASIASAVNLVLVSFLLGFFPPVVLFFVLFLAVAWLTGRPGRTGTILGVVTFTAFLLLNAPFLIPALGVPASAPDFILAVFALLLGAIGLLAAISVLRRSASMDMPRMVWKGAAAIAVLAVVAGIVGALTYDDAVARPGDIELVTEDIEFSTETIESSSGEVSVFVDNKDTTLHTFTIDDLNVDLDVPAGKAARVTFEVPDAGTFVFYCVPHEGDMEGVLRVE